MRPAAQTSLRLINSLILSLFFVCLPASVSAQVELSDLEEGEQFWQWHSEIAFSERGACAKALLWHSNFPGSDYALGQITVETQLNQAEQPYLMTAYCPITYTDQLGGAHEIEEFSVLRCTVRLPDGTMSASNGVCNEQETHVCVGVGNPIDIATGHKRQRSLDWASPLDPRFSFVRHYTSDPAITNLAARGFGHGWSSPWLSAVKLRGDTRHYVYFSGSRMHEFRGYYSTRPVSGHHGFRYDPAVRTEEYRDVVRFPDGRKDIYEGQNRFRARLVERRWPDGYSVFVTYDEAGNLEALQDNRGQRAVFQWLASATGDWASAPPGGAGGAPGMSFLPDVVERIEIDTDYDGSALQPDIVIDYDYEQTSTWAAHLVLTRVQASTRVTVTEVATGRTLTDTRYGYHELDGGSLASIADGRRTSGGSSFDYASFEYEGRYIDLPDPTTPPAGSAAGGGGSTDPQAPTSRYLKRATTTSHTGGADLTQIGFPEDTATGFDVTVTNPLGKQTIYSFEEIAGQDRIVGVEGISTLNCLPSNTTATYNDAGRIIEQIERNGARTVMTRDSEGRILTRTEDADGPNPRVTTYTWTGELRKPLTRTTSELREVFTYDADTLLTSYAQTDMLAGSPDNGKTRTWTYNYTTLASGLKVLTSVDGPGLAADGVNDITTYTYNARGQLLTTTDPNGLTQEVLAYGTSGQPTLIRDHQGFEWALDYDLAGRLLSSTFEPGVLDEVTTYSYDIIGQMLSSTDPLGRSWSYSYDEARRLVQITAPSGDTIGFDHDAMGNVTRTTYSDAAATIAYLEETRYDALGRVLQAIGSNGQTTGFSHDVEDNLDSITDATGLTTTNSYDALNRMAQIVDRAGGTTTMAHDVDNQMTSYIDPRGIETAFDYNGFGDLIREVSADRGTMTYGYNNRGMVTAMTDGRGVVTNYAYDDGGRLLSKTFPADPALDQTFTYHTDPAQPQNLGDLAVVTDQTGQTSYSNDPARGTFYEDLRQIGSASYSTTYTSDAAGQTTQMDYPGGSQLLFSYDADGDLTGLQWRDFDPGTGTLAAPVDVVSAMTYKPHGPLTSLTYGDGGAMTASYDSSYRLTGLTDTRSGTTLRDETYSWTSRDNLSGVTDNLNPAQTQAFTYSNREFLASADGAWGDFDWLYDSVGNRTEQMSLVAGTPLVDVYSYWPDTNQLDSVLLSTGVERRFTYDGAGNVIATNRGALAHSYTYDAANRMASFAVDGVVQAQYQYNALGQQVVRHLTAAGQVIHSLHDARGNRIAEYDYDAVTGTSTLLREYIWANAMIVGVVENGTLYYVRTDHIGRPVFATDHTGVKVWEAIYLPFGGVHTSTGPNSNLRFPGQWFQSETGLHQNWMRDYDPTLGRYLQADPLGLVDGASLYGYALQNPGRYTDFWGLLVDLLLTLDPNRDRLVMTCSCGEEYEVFSGRDEHMNNPSSQSVPNYGPVPRGRYYIVDRPKGRNFIRNFFDTSKDHWFALYRDDGIIDDYTILPDGTRRGNFRLHPGTVSWGCVTLGDFESYEQLRRKLRSTEIDIIPGTNITYYGVLTVQ